MPVAVQLHQRRFSVEQCYTKQVPFALRSFHTSVVHCLKRLRALTTYIGGASVQKTPAPNTMIAVPCLRRRPLTHANSPSAVRRNPTAPSRCKRPALRRAFAGADIVPSAFPCPRDPPAQRHANKEHASVGPYQSQFLPSRRRASHSFHSEHRFHSVHRRADGGSRVRIRLSHPLTQRTVPR